MEERNLWISNDGDRSNWLGKREIAAAVFRHKTLALFCVVLIVAGAAISGIFLPKYESRMKVLVKRERVDPIVSPDQSTQVQVQNVVSEEEMNSEAELMKSDDVLRKVVLE